MFSESRFPITSDTFYGWVNQTPASGNQVYTTVLYAQARIESGNFASGLFSNYNNLFGMRPAVSRPRHYESTIAVSGNGTFAVYADPTQSVVDRVALDYYNGVPIPTTQAQVPAYVDAVLAKGYSADDRAKYKKTWTDIINQYLPGTFTQGGTTALGNGTGQDTDNQLVDWDDIDDADGTRDNKFFGLSKPLVYVGGVLLVGLLIWQIYKRFFKRS